MHNKSTLIKFLKLLGKRLPLYCTGIFLMTAGNAAFEVNCSLLLKKIFEIAQKGRVEKVFGTLITNILFGIISLIIFGIFMRVYNIEAKRGLANLQKKVFDKAMKLPMTYYENSHSGDILSILVFDTSMASEIYISRLRRVIAPVLSVIIYLIPMFYLCPQLTICLLSVNCISILVNGGLVKPMKHIGKELSEKNSKMTEKLSNILQGIGVIKIFDIERNTVKEYQTANYNFTKMQKKKMLLSAGLDGINTGFDLVCSLFFLGIAIIFIKQKLVTIGVVVAIYSMYGEFSAQFLQIGRYLPELMSCIAYADRIFDFLDQPEESQIYAIEENLYDTNGLKKDSVIEIKNIDFAYTPERKIFEQFSMEVKRGTTIALTGESGRGKSTLGKLLLGFYHVQEGEIFIGGKAIGEIGLENLRSQIGYVPQEPYLFNVSLMENIRYGRLNASDQEVYQAAKAANAHEFILKQTQGYYTIAGKRGENLSGGERQRIAIARAILKDAPILLLDEATSALDNKSEGLVQEALMHLMEGKTTIMIAHRLTTIAMAEKEINISEEKEGIIDDKRRN